MTILRVRRFEPAVDWLLGFMWTEARQQRWVCDGCRRPVRQLNARQAREWAEMKRGRRRHVEHRGLLLGRQVCRGRLVKAEAVGS